MTKYQTDFLSRVCAAASEDMQHSGILASLTIAQAILESGWGRSELATHANALFGIKADKRWSGKRYNIPTKEWYDGKTAVTITDDFRAYDSWEESITDHSSFLMGSERYKNVVGEHDYKTSCFAIQQAGYSTDPKYAEQLIRLIEQYNLMQYDKETNMTICKKLANKSNWGGARTGTRFIVVHYTSNDGDTAKNNADYFAREKVGASAHFFVDEKEVWESVPETERAWHCGAKSYRHPECRNENSIGVEICMNDKSGRVRPGSIDHAAELVRMLMDKYHVPLDHVLRHYDVTGKDCPAPMVENPSLWKAFQNKLSTPVPKKEEISVKTYKHTEEMPDWARETFRRLIDAGAVKVDEKGEIAVRESSLQPMVYLDRLCGGHIERLQKLLK